MSHEDDLGEVNTFLLSWDCDGLEACIDVSNHEKAATWAVLTDTTAPSLNHIVSAILLRARANPQRFYEVYMVRTNAGISESTLVELFESSPQQAAELIRERGICIDGKGMGSAKPKIL